MFRSTLMVLFMDSPSTKHTAGDISVFWASAHVPGLAMTAKAATAKATFLMSKLRPLPPWGHTANIWYAHHFRCGVISAWARRVLRSARPLRTGADAAFGPPFALDEVVAFTVPANERSWRLMRRLGMRPDGLFEHPRLPEGHALRPHLLYRMRRDAWLGAGGGPSGPVRP